jgi:hypothetical protein
MKDADEGDNTEEAKHDGADLDSWAEIEDEMVSKGKGKGNRGRGGRVKKPPMQRYVL